MRCIRAIILAFSAYSRVPMPRVKREDDAIKLAIAFLPVIGIAVGGAVWLWQLLCLRLEIGAVLFAAVAAVLPIIITGGIHMDGYIDTSDALAAWRDREKSLEILKDPHIGAFAIIRFGTHLLIVFALLCELFQRGTGGAELGFVYILSRCLAAFSALYMPNARKDGMLAAFTQKADRKMAAAILALLSAAGLAGWFVFAFPQGLLGLVLCLPVTLWYRATAKKRFGGATGDTTGFYLQTIELTILAGLLIGRILFTWLNFC